MHTRHLGDPPLCPCQQPVPGDLVVREIQMPTAGGVAFVVAVHPARDGGPTHQTAESAVLLAHVLALQRSGAVRIWRELPGTGGTYEKVTT